jgi:hypothetical protein
MDWIRLTHTLGVKQIAAVTAELHDIGINKRQ